MITLEQPSQASNPKLQRLFSILAKQKNATQVAKLMLDLCTPAELNALSERVHILQFLEHGLSYREIHAKTGASLTTIGRVARSLQHGYGGYRQLLTKEPKQ